MSWKKVKLGNLCTIEKGKTGIQKAISGKYPLVVTAEDRKSHNEYQFDDEAVIIPLVSGTGHGHASIKRLHFQSGKFALGTILCAVIPKDKTVLNAEYLFRFLTLNKERELVDRMKGMANVTLPIKEIAKIEIPLPSLQEQIEFVEKYSLLEIDTTEISNELKYQLNLIKQLRKAFLCEAMQGKLVNNININETGQQLLSKIKEEKVQLLAEKKLKKEKTLPPVTKDEIPFKIPEHWVWCRLGEIVEIKGGKRVPNGYQLLSERTDHVYLRIVDMKNGTISEKNLKYISDEIFNSIKNYTINKDELYITIAGTIGQIGEIPNHLDGANLTENAAKLRTFLINKYFLKLLLNTSYCQIQFIDNTKKATAQPKLAIKRIESIIIALPSLYEQEKIVAKLNELMAFCDGLEQSIKESQAYNKMLLQQVLREALQPKEEIKVVPIQTRKLPNPLKTVLAAHIVSTCNTRDFGRVKFQKLLFLVEYFCKIDFESKYVKKAAGPYDYQLIKQIEQDFNRMNFFKVEQDKSDNHRVTYTPRSASFEINGFFLENFPNESVKINSLLMKMRPLSWSECEIVATIFAVWNNRLIKKELVTDELLYNDFMAWSSRKSNLAKDFHKKLFWMKEERIIPEGWGNYVDEPSL